MKIVTSGDSYLDIDAYACAIAYAELLHAQGIEARAFTSGTLNESVCATVRSWGVPIDFEYQPNPDDAFVLVDLSDPKFFDRVVDANRVEEVIDHHLGFEEYWRDRIGDGAQIEFIGAACTLIYERWLKAGLLAQMSQLSARLLTCGIIDNTLNFGASVTTSRDRAAYDALLPLAGLPEAWTEQYFRECEASIVVHPERALLNDLKQVGFSLFAKPVCVGQMAVWNAQEMLEQNSAVLKQTLAALQPEWFVNIISVGEQKSYFVAVNASVQTWLERLLAIRFEEDIAISDHVWLRKEIVRQDRLKSGV